MNTPKASIIKCVFGLLLLAACQKDPAPDPRAESLGDYAYHLTGYTLKNGSLIEIVGGSSSGALSVIVSPTDSKGIKFIENGTTLFSGVDVTSTSDGYSFNVLPVTTQSGGNTYIYSPYNGPAHYIRAKKSFQFYIQSAPVIVYVDISK